MAEHGMVQEGEWLCSPEESEQMLLASGFAPPEPAAEPIPAAQPHPSDDETQVCPFSSRMVTRQEPANLAAACLQNANCKL